jgi:hypothetical protein
MNRPCPLATALQTKTGNNHDSPSHGRYLLWSKKAAGFKALPHQLNAQAGRRGSLLAVRHETSTNPPRQFLLVFDVAGKTQLQRLTSDQSWNSRLQYLSDPYWRAWSDHSPGWAGPSLLRRCWLWFPAWTSAMQSRLAHICDRYFFRRCRCIREKGASNIRIGTLM